MKLTGRTILRKRKAAVFALTVVISSFALLSNTWGSSVPAPRVYTVRPKDTLYAISRRYGISLKRILEINDLSLRDKIYPGQKLLIPWKGIWHTIRKGEYLRLIAKAYGETYGISEKVIMKGIVEANKITNLDKIKAGQKLFIPRAKETLEIEIPGKKLPHPQKGIYHTIKKGETIFRIALNYGKDQGLTEKEMEKKIMRANNISDSTKLRTGDKLFVPGAKKNLQIKIPPELLIKEKTPLAPAQVELAEEKTIFSWPVEGEVVGYFGDKENKGIDIAASEGTTVVAPADGVVDFAGEYKDLGRYLVIKHKKAGLITLYLHLSSWLVDGGDKVKKGDPIARVGITGTTKVPCLHFEVRKLKTVEPENPLDYLP